MVDHGLRFVVDYIWATENEIAIDKSVYALSGVSPEDLNFFPRPSKVIAKYARNRRLFKLVVGLLKKIWNFGGSTTYYLYEMFNFYRHSLRCSNKLHSTHNIVDYALAFSTRARDILQPSVLGFSPQCWITFPWVPLNAQIPNEQHIDVFSLLEGKDIFRAFNLAIIASKKLASRSHTKNWNLQSYTAFRWFAVRIALEKLDIQRLVIAEHYDRWAVLVDKVAARKHASLVMMQHGALSGLKLVGDRTQARLPFLLKHRLSSITQLYVYDEFSRIVFETDVITTECIAKGLSVSFFQPMIELTRFTSEKAVRILFVGHPICEALHIYLHQELHREYGANFYYKPHPTAGFSDSVRQQGWHIIEDRRCFPDVDFLIAYPSTLVNEYSASGICAVLHSLDQDKDFSAGLLESVKSKLDALACEKLV